MEFISLWDGAGDAAEAAAEDRALALAKAASMGFWPFLAGAQTEQEYVHREALAEDRITLAAEAGGVTTVTLAQSLKSDWDILAEARKTAADNDSEERCIHCHKTRGGAGEECFGQPLVAGGKQTHDFRAKKSAAAAPEPPPFSVEPKVSGRHDPVAYTYEADMHCPGCAAKRFGTDEHGHVYGTDSEGNEVHPVAPWDEVGEGGDHCGTCGGEIRVGHTASLKVRRLAIVHVAGFPPADGDDDGQADVDGDGQDDDAANEVAPQAQGYYVLDEDSNLDIGGPYANKADAADAIDAGVFDADPQGVTVQKGTVAENGGDDQQDPNADPNADPAADPNDTDGTGDADSQSDGNPFAKGGSISTQANPYTDDNPYATPGGEDNAYDGKQSDDDKDSSTPDLAGGLPNDGDPGEPGGSLTTKPRQMPGGSNTPQVGGDATGTNIPPAT